MKKVFISYSSNDNNKKDILVDVIKSNTSFDPVVVADKAAPGKELAKKVKDSLDDRNLVYFIPIITNNSLNNQWVNQEIGYVYAEAKRIEIIPIVDSAQLGELKGFIHNGLDTPYQFNVDNNNNSFKYVAEKLSCYLRDEQTKIRLWDFLQKDFFKAKLSKNKIERLFNSIGNKYHFNGFLEFSVGEFKDSMSPEALIQAIKARSGIDVPVAPTSIESLNKLLEQKDLYKVMKERPDEAKDLISRLEQGKQLNLSEIIRLNSLLIETNYPLETPKSHFNNSNIENNFLGFDSAEYRGFVEFVFKEYRDGGHCDRNMSKCEKIFSEEKNPYEFKKINGERKLIKKEEDKGRE